MSHDIPMILGAGIPPIIQESTSFGPCFGLSPLRPLVAQLLQQCIANGAHDPHAIVAFPGELLRAFRLDLFRVITCRHAKPPASPGPFLGKVPICFFRVKDPCKAGDHQKFWFFGVENQKSQGAPKANGQW